MLMSDHTLNLLDLEDVIITNVENISNQLHISIELPRKQHICPVCGAVTDRIHDYRMQTIRDIPLVRDTFLNLAGKASTTAFLLSRTFAMGVIFTAENIRVFLPEDRMTRKQSKS